MRLGASCSVFGGSVVVHSGCQSGQRAACCFLPYGGFIRVVFDRLQDEGGGGGVDLLQQDLVHVLQLGQIWKEMYK